MRIAVLTSGGDAPGMNAALRAVARTGFFRGWEVMGVWDGYRGLLEGRIYPMDRRRLGGIIHRGGTVLGTERSAEFATPEGQRKAAGKLAEAEIDGLIVIGGNGSLTGALKLADLGVSVVGIPASIDNDIWGTDTAIGVDTALNTALEAIDRIKDTASSHRRAHVVEVMGRDCGYLALMSAIAGGAEAAVVPEFEPRPEGLLRFLKMAYEQGKSHFIVVVAEGAPVSAEDLHEYFNNEGTYDSRLTVVGHIQRGGSPTASDRILASRFGAAAIEALADGEVGTMVALRGEKVERVPIKDVIGKERPLDPDLYKIAEVLAELPE
ncbi:MAG TPA: 6-phosphofructokinase [Rubrobacteraceae bacterium]|nr:6-phosphofructokinase [Rubrobacteraceae bacterium]